MPFCCSVETNVDQELISETGKKEGKSYTAKIVVQLDHLVYRK